MPAFILARIPLRLPLGQPPELLQPDPHLPPVGRLAAHAAEADAPEDRSVLLADLVEADGGHGSLNNDTDCDSACCRNLEACLAYSGFNSTPIYFRPIFTAW